MSVSGCFTESDLLFDSFSLVCHGMLADGLVFVSSCGSCIGTTSSILCIFILCSIVFLGF